eukprot:9469601-Pyramimonas_sp.AAC.1
MNSKTSSISSCQPALQRLSSRDATPRSPRSIFRLRSTAFSIAASILHLVALGPSPCNSSTRVSPLGSPAMSSSMPSVSGTSTMLVDAASAALRS